MSKITPGTSITQKGVDSAVGRARAGEEGPNQPIIHQQFSDLQLRG
jgi:hypothetical protein